MYQTQTLVHLTSGSTWQLRSDSQFVFSQKTEFDVRCTKLKHLFISQLLLRSPRDRLVRAFLPSESTQQDSGASESVPRSISANWHFPKITDVRRFAACSK